MQYSKALQKIKIQKNYTGPKELRWDDNCVGVGRRFVFNAIWFDCKYCVDSHLTVQFAKRCFVRPVPTLWAWLKSGRQPWFSST